MSRIGLSVRFVVLTAPDPFSQYSTAMLVVLRAEQVADQKTLRILQEQHHRCDGKQRRIERCRQREKKDSAQRRISARWGPGET
jgi:hypothetical protein